MTTLADFQATTLKGAEVDLASYVGQVVLVVNTASKCGLTPQYEGLESLHRELADEGLAVLGFPCNQFAGQEPGDAEAIEDFCTINYGVSFPMFAKVEVNGKAAHPLFQWLRSETSGLLGSSVKWNFTKFLVGRDGNVVRRYSPTTLPGTLVEDIRAELAKPAG